MKRTVITLYIVVVAVLAAATIVEKYRGTAFAAEWVYGAWWFSALWAVLTAAAIVYFVQRRVRRASVVALHLSFVVILAGALITHLTARHGLVHLRQGQPATTFLSDDGQQLPLPFAIDLQRFEVLYHEGTDAPADYVSHITIADQPYTLSMNRIATCQGFRLYQSSYDNDLQGSILAVNSDPWGIPVTYLGYALLFLSLAWVLIDPHGAFRSLLREAASKRLTVLMAAALFASAAHAEPRVLPTDVAEQFGRLYVVANGRVCPMQTYAIDFTKKLCGRTHYADYTAEQVLTGFIFFYDDWTREPVIRVKNSAMKQRLGLPDHMAYTSFFTQRGYVLGPVLQDRDAAKLDEKIMLIMQLHQGTTLKVFPHTADNAQTTWYAPTAPLPEQMDEEHRKYMRDVFTRLNGEVQAGRYDVARQYLQRLLLYQQTFGRESLPSNVQTAAERLYNCIPFATILFMACLTMGFLLFFVGLARHEWLRSPLPQLLLGIAFAALTLCLALRWIVTATIPLSNGYETMLTLAWMVMFLSIFSARRFPLMVAFGFILSGFFLLVSHISQMDPQMSHLMPVLNSPWLTIHVSVIMMAYALLSLTFVCSLTALLSRSTDKADEMRLLSQLMLYPALAFLGFGIFIGAIWANVSWGTYWSWDPKETWALITFMVYAIPAHRSLRINYHVYMVLAFATLLMTYFGVNYFLGGMHAYA